MARSVEYVQMAAFASGDYKRKRLVNPVRMVKVPVCLAGWLGWTVAASLSCIGSLSLSISHWSLGYSYDSLFTASQSWSCWLCLDPNFRFKFLTFSIISTCHTYITFQSHRTNFNPNFQLWKELNTAAVVNRMLEDIKVL